MLLRAHQVEVVFVVGRVAVLGEGERVRIEVFDELEGNAARAVWAFAAESVIAVLREQATGWPAGARRAP